MSLPFQFQKMNFYKLFDYESLEWLEINELLNETNLTTLNDVKLFISNLAKLPDDIEFKTLDALKQFYNENELASIFNKIRQYALRLPCLFPLGKITRLNETNPRVDLKRFEILCLLCHMILCTLKKSKKNLYWVTFENWLTDGRSCAVTYLQTLIEYFRQTFSTQDIESDEFMNETVIFKRNSSDLKIIMDILKSDACKFKDVSFSLNGSIGDENGLPEVDFANCDIGYGITGTQEEILFGASPELCVSMLFCDTLKEDDAISITGARKISNFNGYGLDINLNSFIPKESRCWRERTIIAIDAIDFSYEFGPNLFKNQLLPENLNRELVKAFAGFSLVNDTKICTGHWGCGCFSGNKQLKALIQLVAASISNNSLLFYSYGDAEFLEAFNLFLAELKYKNVSVSTLWSFILSLENDLKDENVFNFLKNKF